MRHLNKLAIVPYEGRYDVVSVSSYLLSIRLKTIGVDSKELSNAIGMSPRNAQRYIYNSYYKSIPCLSSIYNCLKFANISLSKFFKDVEYFMSNQVYIALYDFKKDKVNHYSKKEYEALEFNQKDLNAAISERKYIVEKCGLKFVKPFIAELDNNISQYPIHMIKGKTYVNQNKV